MMPKMNAAVPITIKPDWLGLYIINQLIRVWCGHQPNANDDST